VSEAVAVVPAVVEFEIVEFVEKLEPSSVALALGTVSQEGGLNRFPDLVPIDQNSYCSISHMRESLTYLPPQLGKGADGL
jgi:hypothetical protein